MVYMCVCFRDSGSILSTQALEFLALENSKSLQLSLLEQIFSKLPQLTTVITCMEILEKVGDKGKKPRSNLVVGTESG